MFLNFVGNSYSKEECLEKFGGYTIDDYGLYTIQNERDFGDLYLSNKLITGIEYAGDGSSIGLSNKEIFDTIEKILRPYMPGYDKLVTSYGFGGWMHNGQPVEERVLIVKLDVHPFYTSMLAERIRLALRQKSVLTTDNVGFARFIEEDE